MFNNNSGNPLVRSAVRGVLAGGALAMSFGMAHAQNASDNGGSTAKKEPTQLKEVVVTGSLIATPNQVSMSPVTFVSAQAIQQTGATRIEDMLNQLPQVFADQGSNIVNGATGTATIDLRDLGSNRTLVLVDGQRLQPGDPRSGGAVDVNMIPAALISSIQIQTGGASSIYGADAVAGVVNFRLKQNFQGVELDLNGGMYQNDNGNTAGVQSAISTFNSTYGTNFQQAPSSVWTGAQKEIDFIAGVSTPDGKGNATFYATYRNINSVLQSQYSVSACSLGSGYSGGPLHCLGSSNGYPGRFIFANAAGTTFDQSVNLATGALVPYSPAYDFNFGPLNYFQRPDERYTAGSFLHYTFNRHVTVYSNSMFMDDQSLAQIAPSGAFLGTPYTVNCANPFLSSSMVSTWCGGSPAGTTSLYIGRRNIEGGNRVDNLEHTDFNETIGAKGEINDNWSYNGSFQYGFSQLSETYLNDLSVTKINDALDVVMGPNGPECAVTAAGVSNGLGKGCVPWNIFGHGGSAYLSPAAGSAYLSTPGVQRGKIAQTMVNLVLNGDLSQYVTLPSAHSGLQVALGADYRDDKSFTQPDAEFQTADLAGQGGATLPVAGDVIVREGYGEARLPLIQDKPFAESLAIDGSYRFSSYSPFNGSSKGVTTNTYGFSAAWKPSHDYRVRASFDRAVRAPNVGELYSAQSVSLDGNVDPCAGTAPSASLANCERSGVSASQYGNVLPAPASQYNGKQGGNPGLQPETALTSSFGLGWTPSYVPGLSAELDYYDIKIENVVAQLGGNTIITQCVTSDLFCQDVHRAPNGALWGQSGYAIDVLQNIGKLEEKGLDVDVNYELGLNNYGRLAFALQGTYMLGFYTTTVAAIPSTRYDCAGYYGPICGEPVSKWRHRASVTWMTPWHGLQATATWRYYSAVTLDQLSPNPTLGLINGGASIANGQISNTDAHIGSYSYLDLTAAMPVAPGVTVRLGVNNVLDKQPPVIGLSDLPSVFGNGNTFPQVYDSLGRYIFADVTAKF
ncbi:MAG: TonB-dependent receptor domain-containing protein [Steroidobacteraceae bacterium]